MKVYDAASIRNIAVVGHGGCGKTQLVSALLFAAGAVNRLGKAEEIARGVAFLVDENAGFVTGSTLSINGGQHMY